MSSAASDPALIGVDWGTSSLRAFLIGADGAVLDSVARPQGILHVEGKDFDAVFNGLVRPWMAARLLPVVASGMITSRNGWLETPYLPLPSGIDDLAHGLVPLVSSAGVRLHFVTGMAADHDGAPDVMRGEETQIVGAAGLGMDDGIFVMPGTHSKWVSVAGGRIEDFATYMTGEVFGALRSHTILGSLMTDGPFSDEGFRAGVKAGLEGGDDLLHRLFQVRTLPLFGKIGVEMVADHLSGLLVGAEIRAASRGRKAPSMVTIVGRGDLAERYQIALELASIQSRRAPEDIVARGHFLIAKAAGLLK